MQLVLDENYIVIASHDDITNITNLYPGFIIVKSDKDAEIGSFFEFDLEERKNERKLELKLKWNDFFNGIGTTIKINFHCQVEKNDHLKNVDHIHALLMTTGGHLNTIMPIYATANIPVKFVTADGWTLVNCNFASLFKAYLEAVALVSSYCRLTEDKINRAQTLEEVDAVVIDFNMFQ